MALSELLWFTGILEGEGTFALNRVHGAIRVAMTDRDIIERLQAVSGVGLIHSRAPRTSRRQATWDWEVVRVETVGKLAASVAPFLLGRRRDRVGDLLGRHGIFLPPPTPILGGSLEAWAWVAGLLEGEGWLSPGPATHARKVKLGVSSTDWDVLDRLHVLTGAGSIYPVKRRRETWKPAWQWTVSNRRDVHGILNQILPWLGERRSERARYVLRKT
jgi:hypothetical protein